MYDPSLLREARRAGGFSLRQVGDRAHLDRSAIAHYEAGRARASKAALERWRNALVELLRQRFNEINDAVARI